MTTSSAIGLVIEVSGTRARISPEVELCTACKASGRCAGVSIARAACDPSEFWVDNPIAAAVGDRVALSDPPLGVVSLATISYLIPLLGLLAGAGVGSMHGSWLAVSLALTGFALAFVVLKMLGAFHREKLGMPTIVRNLSGISHSMTMGEMSEEKISTTGACGFNRKGKET